MAGTRSKTAKQAAPQKKRENGAGVDDKKIALREQLDRAEQAVSSNRASVLELHSNWRTSLLRMSYIVIVVTLHQAQMPSADCMKEIKQLNELRKNSMEEPMSGYQAAGAILRNSSTEVVSIICATSLAWCLGMPMQQSDFATPAYSFSISCLFIVISLFMNNKTVGCVNDELVQILGEPMEERRRAFPLVLVFHGIASLSLWFMQYQIRQCDENVEKIQQMKNNLLEREEKPAGKKQK